MTRPAISVIMCVRNGEAFIGEALDSLASQGISPVETVIIDDGSTDRTAALAIAHPMSPILVRQPQQGLAAALNAGVAHTTGELVAFLDHDDVWPQGRLKAMQEALQQEPALDAIFGHVVNTNVALKPVGPPTSARLITAMLIRRAALQHVGAFRTDVSHAANVDWISRAELAGLRSRFLDRVVLWRRIHGDNMGVRDRGTARTDMLRVIRDHHNRTRRA